jgi:hypothetical protein
MPDRITQIKNLLVGLKENSVAELRDDTDKVVERIETLLEGCSDNSQVIIAFDRSQLNDYIWSNTNKTYKCTDAEWEEAVNIVHDDDTAWGYISDACYKAECNLYDKLEDEGRLPS